MYYSPFKDDKNQDIGFDKIEYKDLSQLKNCEEGYKIEFKSDFNNDTQKKIPKIICSFANSSGGWLVFGIDNLTKDIKDIPRPHGEIELNIINKIEQFVDMEVLNLFNARFIENPANPGFGVIVVLVREGLHPPYISNGSIFVRSGAQSVPIPAERSTVDYLYKKSEKSSIILLKGIDHGNLIENFVKLEDENLLYLNKQYEDLFQKICSNIKNSEFNPSFQHLRKEECSSEKIAAAALLDDFRGKEMKPADYLSNLIENIKLFIEVNDINADLEKLFDFGDLQFFERIRILEAPEITCEGSAESKNKYENIKEIYHDIILLKGMNSFLKVLNNVFKVELALINEGSNFDEDIQLNIYIPKNSYCDIKNLFLDSNANFYNKQLENTFVKNNYAQIDDYDSYYPEVYPTPPFCVSEHLGLYNKSDQEYEKELIEAEIKSRYESICLVTYDKEYDVLKINFKNLLPNQSKMLPTPLFFKGDFKELRYEIISRHSSKKIEQVIKSKQKTG